MRLRRLIGAVFAASAAIPVVLLASGAPAQANTPGCVQEKTVVTTVQNRSDNGYGDNGSGSGVWAKSAFTRTVVLCEKAPVVPAAAAATIVNYTATVSDSGTFVTLGGADLAPDHGGALVAGIPGTVVGGFTATFTALANFEGFDDSNLKDKTIIGDPASPQTPANPSTGQWVKSMFPAATSFAGNSLDGDSWGWTYKTCNEQWIEAAAGHTGNITGSQACPQLPVNGFSATELILAGASLVILGGVAVIFTTRRRRTA